MYRNPIDTVYSWWKRGLGKRLGKDYNLAVPTGFEPVTFRLTAERATQLRHGS